MNNNVSFKSGFIASLIVMCIVLSASKTFAQLDTTMHFTFKPNWKNGMELVYFHKTTNLNTNERDMPIYMTIDSLYSVMNISYTDSNTWIVGITHYMKYDKPSKTAYLETRESLRNAPVLLEFDDSFNYIGLKNWEQWRDTLLQNLRIEFENKKIGLNTYDEYRKLYEQPEEVELVVANYYLNMFSIIGRRVNLWIKDPIICEIPNPFKDRESISKSGDEIFYITSENRDEIKHSFNSVTDESDFQSLAEDYLNYLTGTSGGEVNIPPPRIIVSRDEYHTFDKLRRNISEFRMETSVKINGAGTFLEYRLILLNTREPK
ncbi:MAG: hypothetical protein J5I91_07400 [Bacteroidetes bacterium]|nr:hypothetical protein [Bacteroidota bacterium]